MATTQVFDLEGQVTLKSDEFSQRVKQVHKEIGSLRRSFEAMARYDAGLIKPTKKAKDLAEELTLTTERVNELEQALNDLQNTEGADPTTIQQVADALEVAQTRAAELDTELSGMSFYGKNGRFEETGPASLLADLKAYAQEARNILGGVVEGFRTEFAKAFASGVSERSPGLAKVVSGLESLRTRTHDARYLFKHYMEGMVNDMRKAGGKIFGWLKRTGFGFKALTGHTRSATAGVHGLMTKIVGLGLAVLGTTSLINAAKQGMQNLIAYDSATAASVNSLKASLTTLQNAFATAFAPILNVVAPLLITLIDYLVAAATAVAHFMAALTGQSQVVVARKATSGVASGIGNIGSAADSANNSAQQLQRTLMGFDQINKLDDNSGSGSGGSGGGGGGGGAGGLGNMFETVPISSTMENWAQKIKDAWANADFYDLGQTLGTKLKNGLDAIPWDDIQAVGAKIGKSLATGLNGFIETPGLFTTVGETIAEALNTLTITVNSFAINFHWSSLGTAMSDSINGFFSTFNFKLAAQTISNIAKGFLDTMIAAVEGVNWKNIGTKIIEFVSNIQWVEIAKKMINLLTSAVKGAGDLLSGVVEAIGDKLEEYISSGEIWKDIGSLGKATIELAASITGAAWDLLQTIINSGAKIALSLLKSGWTSIKKFLFGDDNEDGVVSAKLSLLKNAWTSFKKFLFGESNEDGVFTAKISLLKNLWTSFKKFLFGDDNEDGKFTAKINREGSWTDSVKKFLLGKDDDSAVATGKVGRTKGWSDSVRSFFTGKDKDETVVTAKVGRKRDFGNIGTREFLTGKADDKTVVSAKVGRKRDFGDMSTHEFLTGKKNDDRVTTAKVGRTRDFGGMNTREFLTGVSSDKEVVSAKVGRTKNWSTSITQWITGNKAGKVSVGISLFKSGWSTIKSFFGLKSGGINTGHGWKMFAGGGMYSNGSWKPITAAAGGGSFAQGQVFVAREAGPELVGNIGAHTAVMNNNQIVASVAAGVAQAVAATIGNQSNEVNVYLQGDAGTFFRVIQQKANSYTRATGQPAFPV